MATNIGIGATVMRLQDLDKTKLTIAGGKGANLGELCRIEGILVPDGFCITTEAFKKVIGESKIVGELLDRLAVLRVEDRREINQHCNQIRKHIEDVIIPGDIEEEIIHFLNGFAESAAFAIRSSATAEDLPTASFAGQQDSYLNIIGHAEVLKHIVKCWASLFTERAVVYRIQNGFDHRKIQLAVVVQQMVFPEASGIMFTADPVTGNRKTVSIDAGFGLGEAMVSGVVNADNYKVLQGQIIDKKISAKKIAFYASGTGGTMELEVDPKLRETQTLTNEQILELEIIGRKIESHFGSPQDIEWCLADGRFYIVQSRPITTLYPIPENSEPESHVYISVGHQQMMTDAMKPLGLSIWQLMAGRPMYKAGGRLFVDVFKELSYATGRERLLNAMGQHDPLIENALVALIDRGDFIKPIQREAPQASNPVTPVFSANAQTENDPAIITELIADAEASITTLKKDIQTRSGVDLFDFILQDLQQRKQSLLLPKKMAAIMAVVNAASWINKNMEEWLGEKGAADKLTQSVSNNITSEMGLALLHVADVVRPYSDVIAFLQQVKDDSFLDELQGLKGGKQTRDAIYGYLNKYGMRCAGEIDITKTRWNENPAMLVPLILSNIKNVESGAGNRKFKEGLTEALEKKRELLDKLKQLPDGEQKAAEAEQMIDQLRDFAGYREYPKYEIVNRLWVYKQALLKEASQLIKASVIAQVEDLHYLTFDEFREAVRTGNVDHELISNRKEEHQINEKLNPPRVITSDGEIITGSYKHEKLPANAIAGLAVSAGTIEGRARVILSMEHADLQHEDILVTVFTDPSWTPLFVSVKGLVTEVGGLMTHGAVIAREYGLPAVVGVENATKLIKDGQRIRVNGTEGYVEIL